MRTAALVVVGFLVSLSAAQAEPCKTQGSPDAREIVLDLESVATREGLNISLQLGLLPAEFPEAEIRARKSPCSRGTFMVFTHRFELFGEDDDLPPRWAISSSAGNLMTLYLALMPRPEPALAWYKKTRPQGPGEVRFEDDEYMLALVALLQDGGRMVFAFFDKTPEDAKLKEWMQKIGTGKARWLVAFDVKERETVVNPNR